jgi:hypothetical protein
MEDADSERSGEQNGDHFFLGKLKVEPQFGQDSKAVTIGV